MRRRSLLAVLIVVAAASIGSYAFAQPAAPSTTHHRSRLGSPPRDPGPIPRNVDDMAVAAAWNTAWGKDPACRPGPGPAVSSGVSYGTPSAAMLSTIPALRRPATRTDRLPASLYGHDRPQLLFRGGDVYVRFIRRARVADGITFYLVPATQLGRPPLSPAAADRCYRLTADALRAELPTIPSTKRAATLRYGDAEFALGRYNLETSSAHEGVFLFTVRANGGGGADGGQSPSTIRQTGMLGGGGGGRPPSPIVMNGIVPSGVATVTLQFPASRHGSQRLPALSAVDRKFGRVYAAVAS